jgi:Glycosyl transferase family 8
MNSTAPVIFIGSGEASVLERKTLQWSIRKHTPGPVEVIVFNGTHNSIEIDGGSAIPVAMPLHAKYQNITEFSHYRFMIPQLRGHTGRAIWLDSDMVCLADLNELFNVEMGDHAFLAKRSLHPSGEVRWGLSVAVYDNARCSFDLDRYAREIDEGLYAYNDLQQMTPRFLARYPFSVGAIDEQWNCYDELTPQTKLIHYTNLHTQPWKVRGHRHGGLWFRYFQEAREAGFISDEDIERAIRRSYVRPDLLKGNTIGVRDIVHNALSDLKASVRETLRPGNG